MSSPKRVARLVQVQFLQADMQGYEDDLQYPVARKLRGQTYIRGVRVNRLELSEPELLSDFSKAIALFYLVTGRHGPLELEYIMATS